MSQSVCRWGILGAATIAQKNWNSIRNAENATLKAVASRSEDRALAFIDLCQSSAPYADVPEAVEGYDALLQRDDIDAVYIPLPTGLRKEWVLKAAEAGKHVMCEKPCALNAADLSEMIEACRANNVQFMDGVMFMHSKRLSELRRVLDDGKSIGDMRRIATQFSFCAPDEWMESNIRTSSTLEPFGALGDLGWYNIRFTLFAMNYVMPTRVMGRMLSQQGRGDSPSPVPTEFFGEMFFEGGVSASMYCSFITEHQQWANVSGTKGYLQVSDFVLPFFGNEVAFDVCQAKFVVEACDFNMEEHTQRVAVNEYASGTPCAQETNLFRNFSQLAVSGDLNDHWPRIALQTQQVMEAMVASANDDSAPITLS